MGIDRIKGPPLPPPAEIGPSRPAAATTRAFETPATEAARQPSVVEPSSVALQRLRAGEIDLDHYVDLKIQESAAHLSALPASELDTIRSALRDRLASDPLFVDLMRTATGGAALRPPDDD